MICNHGAVHYGRIPRKQFGDKPADWAKENWTNKRRRICICHAKYSGCNNNFGIRVGFRDIKEAKSANACVGTFIRGLVHNMKEQDKEDERNMIKVENGTPDAFIKSPVATKAMCDRVQSMHQKTLRVSSVLGNGKHARELDQKFHDMADAISESEQLERDTPLHLKMLVWHENGGLPVNTFLQDFKSILIPMRTWTVVSWDQ
jgi:hypothetical protein